MKFRKNIFPRSLPDLGATAFLATAIPTIFYFELWIVLPTVYKPGTFWSCVHCTAGTFLLLNVVANALAIMLCETSIRGTVLAPPEGVKWKTCLICECLVPPRSWHCTTCRTCILKRDHHCVFTGCCIGHKNHRYFIMLLTFLFLSTAYATYFNHFYIWQRRSFSAWTLLEVVFPLAMLFISTSREQFEMVMYLINIIGMCFTGALLLYHGRIITKGAVCHQKVAHEYDLGWKCNLIGIFGSRWYLAWLFPLISSPLPQDGINWSPKESLKGR